MPRPTPFVIKLTGDFLRQNPNLSDLAKRLSQAYEQNNEFVDDTRLRKVGTALWHALRLDGALDKAKEKAGQIALPVIVETEDAAVSALPWETLYHPVQNIFLGRSAGFTLSRRSAGLLPALPEPEPGPLKVLLFTSLPDDLGEDKRLDVEGEQAAVQEALLESERKGEVVLEMPDDGRFATLQSQLQEFEPHLVYLRGHGQFTYEHHNHRAWGSFLFEDSAGRQDPVSEDKIGECFQNTGVQLVVLSACRSGRHHPDYPLNGLTQRLYRRGIPYVIGIRESIKDKAGIGFAYALMKSLAQGEPVDIALQSARAAIAKPTEREAGDPAREVIPSGQWCLPLMMSHSHDRSLIDWDFTPQPRRYSDLKTQLGCVTIPDLFIGRRRELRQWQNKLRSDKLNRLLITGAGGMGKTALAGKLIDTLRKDGYHFYTFSLLSEHNWQEVLTDMQVALAGDRVLHEKSKLIQAEGTSLSRRAEQTLALLLQLHKGKLGLFFDNLESVQESQSPHSPTDETLAVWIEAARKSTGLKLIITSRFRLPDWPNQEQYQVGRPVYGDYVAISRQLQLPASEEQLRRLYRVLGGNFRALEYFVAAAQRMSIWEEKRFLTTLKDVEAEIQTNMALGKMISQRGEQERELLQRLTAFRTSVPLDGVKALYKSVHLPPSKRRLDANPETLLQNLLNVSLVEQYQNDVTGQTEYGLFPIIHSWLEEGRAKKSDRELLVAAAEFLLWVWDEELNRSWQHLMETHRALEGAGLETKRQRLVLDYIVGPLNRHGMYRHLLDQWLLPLAEADNPAILGKVNGQIGRQYFHLGDYDRALGYLERSLAISQEIGDRSGEGATLNNISTIYHARSDSNRALEYLQRSLAISQEIEDRSGESTTLNNIAQIYHARGDYGRALEQLKRSLTISREIGDRSEEGAALNNISQIYDARGDYGRALEYLKRSLAIRQEIGDRSGEGATLNNISQIYDARGDYARALEYLKSSLAIQEEIGDRSGEGMALNNISTIYHACGDYDRALEYLQRSLTISQEIGDRSGEGTTLNNISQIYHARSDYDRALEYLQRSLAIRQEIGDRSGEGTTLNNMATNAFARGDYARALEYLKRSLATRQEIGDRSGEGATLNNISQIYAAHGDCDRALEYLERSLAIGREIGDLEGICTGLFNMGHIHRQNGEDAEALRVWTAAYRMAKKSNLAQALDTLANLAEQLQLPGGREGWESLLNAVEGESGRDDTFTRKSK